MKLNARTRYPHPVLWSETGDFSPEDLFGFAGEVTLQELTASPTFTFDLEFKQTELGTLLAQDKLCVGVAVRCRETYLDDVRICMLGPNTLEFEAMSLSGEVRLRPIAWTKGAESLLFASAAEEFRGVTFDLAAGAVLAVGEEEVLYVGREKSTPLASIFELRKVDSIDPETFVVDLDDDPIVIAAGVNAHKNIASLRESPPGRISALNGVYLPVMQDVLRIMADEDAHTQHEGKRWFVVLHARLTALGIGLESIEPLAHAQLLFAHPLRKLLPQD